MADTPNARSPRLVPAEATRTEIRVSNSRFIASGGPVFSVEAAKTFITDVRHEFGDATHNVPAYIIGHGASVVAHCNDDGEPSGTAGRPTLAVLRGSGLGDVVVVVTRYFGGTKLGTGGLVRAYSDAVRALLDVMPRAVKRSTHTAEIEISYSAYEPVKQLVAAHNGRVLEESFEAEVTLIAQILQAEYDAFNHSLRERSGGQIQPRIIESDEATIMPLRSERREA